MKQQYKYVRVKLHGGGSYIQAIDELHYALDGELADLPLGDEITITFTPVNITDQEYLNLPEFTGH